MTDVQTRPDAEIATGGEKPRESATSSRRVVLTSAGALGAGCLLAACGTETGTSSSTGANGGDFSDNPAPAGSATAPAGSDGGGSSSGAVLASVADVPEGGGIIKGDYVITQPEAGTFKAFSKICTHQGCPVTKVEGGQIVCPCHNSFFAVADGKPTSGPAKKSLPETKVTVDGDNIVAA